MDSTQGFGLLDLEGSLNGIDLSVLSENTYQSENPSTLEIPTVSLSQVESDQTFSWPFDIAEHVLQDEYMGPFTQPQLPSGDETGACVEPDLNWTMNNVDLSNDLYDLRMTGFSPSENICHNDRQNMSIVPQMLCVDHEEQTQPNTVQDISLRHAPTILPSDMSKHVCRECSQAFRSPMLLRAHCFETDHKGLRCLVNTCGSLFSLDWAVKEHLRTAHPEFLMCYECKTSFSTRENLTWHAWQDGHSAYICEQPDCGSTFSRYDVYERHLKSHRSDVKRHPCQHCRKYRGPNGFKRKDHLTQHLRNYHHIEVEERERFWFGSSRSYCPHKDCPAYRDNSLLKPWQIDLPEYCAFKKASDFTKHMKKVHDESPYPCEEPGCDRIGGKGYFRKRDLLTHQKKVHAKAEEEADEE